MVEWLSQEVQEVAENAMPDTASLQIDCLEVESGKGRALSRGKRSQGIMLRSRGLLSHLLFWVLALTPLSAYGQQVWFSPGDDLEVSGIVTHPDFPKLFEEPSQWPTGLSHINVLQFRAPYIARKPAESAKYDGYLKAHHIAIAATMTVMPAETCGQGIEGIMSRKGIDFYPRAIKANAGIDLDYVVMDEPLYFGHDYAGKNACRLSVADVAKGVAESVATIRSYHPNAKFILSEPEQGLPGGPAELAEFLDAYKAAAHEYPLSVRFDVQWRKDWRNQLPPFVSMLKARGIGYGVVYNAPGGIKEDRAWIASAKENAQAFSAAIRTRPDHVMIQTWDPNPSRIVPESDPNAMTDYLKWYLERLHH
jgi:hypothetical protein